MWSCSPVSTLSGLFRHPMVHRARQTLLVMPILQANTMPDSDIVCNIFDRSMLQHICQPADVPQAVSVFNGPPNGIRHNVNGTKGLGPCEAVCSCEEIDMCLTAMRSHPPWPAPRGFGNEVAPGPALPVASPPE